MENRRYKLFHGAVFHDTTRYVWIDYGPVCNATTQAEKRRDAILWRMKCRKALFNKVLVGILLLLSVGLIFTGVVWAAILVRNTLFSMVAAYVGCQACVLAYMWLTDIVECEPDFIEIKRKR